MDIYKFINIQINLYLSVFGHFKTNKRPVRNSTGLRKDVILLGRVIKPFTVSDLNLEETWINIYIYIDIYKYKSIYVYTYLSYIYIRVTNRPKIFEQVMELNFTILMVDRAWKYIFRKDLRQDVNINS